MSSDAKRLYELLPAVYRIRDAQRPERDTPLEQLIALIASQVEEMQENLEQLYDDQFIETCADWVVPYVGDLIGCRLLDKKASMTATGRAEVANTIAYRRRKGTASMLEQLARDVTRWEARVLEFFEPLATTQHMNHVRLKNLALSRMRNPTALEDYRSPFETLAHLAEVRSVRTRRGRYNIPNVGIFLWRLRPYLLTRVTAFKVDETHFLFSPLGNDLQLFTKPEAEREITHLAERINVPAPISRRLLRDNFAKYYGPGKSIFVEAEGVADMNRIAVCDLSNRGSENDWGRLPTDRDMAIDPVLGRILLRENLLEENAGEENPLEEDQPKPPVVTFCYAFSSDIGGGEYERRSSFVLDADDDQVSVVRVPEEKLSIQEALDFVKEKDAVIEITDNGRYEEPLLSKSLAAGQSVEIRAANGKRPLVVLQGPFVISGGGATVGKRANVVLNGLVVSGRGIQVNAKSVSLGLRHCTLVPGLQLLRDGTPKCPPDDPSVTSTECPDGRQSIEVNSATARVEISQSIVGQVRLHVEAELRLTDSILDATHETRVALVGLALDNKEPAGTVHIERSTVIGRVYVAGMSLVSNSILFAELTPGESWPGPAPAAVVAKKTQTGCVRFSYLPWGSRVPKRHRCCPRNEEQADRIHPSFTSLRYGHPGYCQLRSTCSEEIRKGADDGSEMGVFQNLYQPQREANLRARLEEYLRFGLEAGIFYQT